MEDGPVEAAAVEKPSSSRWDCLSTLLESSLAMYYELHATFTPRTYLMFVTAALARLSNTKFLSIVKPLAHHLGGYQLGIVNCKHTTDESNKLTA